MQPTASARSICAFTPHMRDWPIIAPHVMYNTNMNAEWAKERGVGIGFNPPKYLKHGDTVKIEIAGIGVLENPVRQRGMSTSASQKAEARA